MAKEEIKLPMVKNKVFHCGCTGKEPFAADYQNGKYGKGMRVHTVGGGKDRHTFTCTVCGKER